nr:hypothetical protein RVX_1888 [Nitratidesulfovibrio sp. HK-II]
MDGAGRAPRGWAGARPCAAARRRGRTSRGPSKRTTDRRGGQTVRFARLSGHPPCGGRMAACAVHAASGNPRAGISVRARRKGLPRLGTVG